MKFAWKVTAFVLALIPAQLVFAQHATGSRQHAASAPHDRAPHVRERTLSVRTGR